MPFNSITDVNLSDKRVIIRLDLNLPVQGGLVTDWTRLERSEPTIRHIVEQGGQAVILSHFGRPKGAYAPEYSFDLLFKQLREKLRFRCEMLDHKGKLPLAKLDLPKEVADVLLIDNTRFFEGETSGDAELAKEFAAFGDYFCLDAFSIAHRDHASVTGLARYLPAFAGLSLASELKNLNASLNTVARPSVAIVGGAKVSTKIGVLENLIPKTDTIVVGGGMANTFLKALGHEIGISLVEDEQISTATELMKMADASGCSLVLPLDVATNDSFASTNAALVCDVKDVGRNQMILDFGPASVETIKQTVQAARTVLWNGPLGAFELTPFDIASVELATEVARLCRTGGLTAMAGGGDTLALLAKAGVADDFTFCSTGGGAFLEWLEGKYLPGLAMLEVSS